MQYYDLAAVVEEKGSGTSFLVAWGDFYAISRSNGDWDSLRKRRTVKLVQESHEKEREASKTSPTVWKFSSLSLGTHWEIQINPRIIFEMKFDNFAEYIVFRLGNSLTELSIHFRASSEHQCVTIERLQRQILRFWICVPDLGVKNEL